MSSLNINRTLLQVIAVLLFLPVLGLGQAHERTIKKVSWRTEPIKIVRLKTKGKPIEVGKKFIEDEDIQLIGYRQIRDAMRKG